MVVTWSGVVDDVDAAAFARWRAALAADATRRIALVHDVTGVTAVEPGARRVFSAVAATGAHVRVWIVAPTGPAAGAVAAVRWAKPDARPLIAGSVADAVAEARAALRSL